jgi:hypothetical protein
MENNITASDVKRLMLQSYRRFTNGEISKSRAFKENALLGNILKAIEVSETEERLKAIENALSLNNDNNSYEDE